MHRYPQDPTRWADQDRIDLLHELQQRRFCVQEVCTALHLSRDILRAWYDRLPPLSIKAEKERTEENCNLLIQRLRQEIQSVLPRGTELDFIPGHSPGTVKIDVQRIDETILGLCKNAGESMEKGGRLTIETQNVRINEEYCRTHAWASPGRYVLIMISDTGAGIPEDIRDRIFEAFVSSRDSSGLGLTSARHVLNAHNGLLHLYSEEGIGTTLKLYLPVYEQSAHVIGNALEKRVEGGHETVLLVENNPQVLHVQTLLLQRRGYTVRRASLGQEAVQIFREEKEEIALVVLDMVLPDLHGQEVKEALRQIRPDLPVIFCSGYRDQIPEEEPPEAPPSLWISKPFDPRELLRMVRTAIDRM